MKEDIVSYELAMLLNQLGFDEKTRSWYVEEKSIVEESPNNYWNTHSTALPAPTLSLAQKWFREKHNIQVQIHARSCKNSYNYVSSVWKRQGNGSYFSSLQKPIFTTYEEALEAGLIEACKHLKKI